MGKLADLIKHAGRREPEPMGFGTAARKSLPTMLLVAIAGDRWPRAADDALHAGADALLLTGRPGDTDLKEAVAAANAHACGLLAIDASPQQLQRFQEAGIDFAVLGPGAPAATIVDQKLSLVFLLREDLSDLQLRALEALPFEAIYLDGDATPSTVMRLVELQRIAGLARKPLLIQVAPDTPQAELVTLRDAGVGLIALDMRERNATDALRKLRETIDGLPRRRARREERASVALPRSHGEQEEEEDDEDDE